MRRFAIVLSALFIACGGARKTPGSSSEATDPALPREALVPRAVLAKADFTTEVDMKRYRAAGPVLGEFLPTDKAVYLVGKLKQVPTDAAIEVRWFRRENPVPLAANTVRGSATYQFIASYSPPEGRFKPGGYVARVYVNGQEVGARTFVVLEDEVARMGPMVTGVAISEKVTDKMLPVDPADRFKENTPKIFLSFDVSGTEPGMSAAVRWYREGELFHEQQVALEGNERYAIHILASDGLPSGEYSAEVLIGGEPKYRSSFTIASGAAGPSIDALKLGTELTADNMPARPLTVFPSDTAMIYCGLRFLDLPANSTIVLNWIRLPAPTAGGEAPGEGSEEPPQEAVLYTSRSALPDGGSGVLRASWQPFDLLPGSYKVAVIVGETLLSESRFEVVDAAAPDGGFTGSYLR